MCSQWQGNRNKKAHSKHDLLDDASAAQISKMQNLQTEREQGQEEVEYPHHEVKLQFCR